MVHCPWGLCSNDDKYNKQSRKRPKAEFLGTKWIPWPKDPALLQRWINACATENLKKPSDITRAKRICSLHFVGGKGPTEEYPNPLPCNRSEAEMASWLRKSKERRKLSYKSIESNSQDHWSGTNIGDRSSRDVMVRMDEDKQHEVDRPVKLSNSTGHPEEILVRREVEPIVIAPLGLDTIAPYSDTLSENDLYTFIKTEDTDAERQAVNSGSFPASANSLEISMETQSAEQTPVVIGALSSASVAVPLLTHEYVPIKSETPTIAMNISSERQLANITKDAREYNSMAPKTMSADEKNLTSSPKFLLEFVTAADMTFVQRELTCGICNVVISRSDEEEHFREHLKDTMFRCRHNSINRGYKGCVHEQNWTDFDYYFEHRSTYGHQFFFYCKICRVSVGGAFSYLAHLKLHQPDVSNADNNDLAKKEGQSQCLFCDFSIPSNKLSIITLTRHTIKHFPETRYFCKVCLDTFDNYEVGLAHTQVHPMAVSGRFLLGCMCGICGWIHFHSHSLMNHLLTHTPGKRKDKPPPDLFSCKDLCPGLCNLSFCEVHLDRTEVESCSAKFRDVDSLRHHILEEHYLPVSEGDSLAEEKAPGAKKMKMDTSPCPDTVDGSDSSLVHSCPMCNVICLGRIMYLTHMGTHFPNTRFFCLACLHTSGDYPDIILHLMRSHNLPVKDRCAAVGCLCPFCGLMSNDCDAFPGHLSKHMCSEEAKLFSKTQVTFSCSTLCTFLTRARSASLDEVKIEFYRKDSAGCQAKFQDPEKLTEHVFQAHFHTGGYYKKNKSSKIKMKEEKCSTMNHRVMEEISFNVNYAKDDSSKKKDKKEKSLEIKPGVSKPLATSTGLKLKIYVCKLCSKKFIQEHYLRRHMELHES